MASYRKVHRKNVVPYDPQTNYTNVVRLEEKNFCILDIDLPRGTFITLSGGDLIEVLRQEGRDRVLRVVTLEALAAEGYEVEPA